MAAVAPASRSFTGQAFDGSVYRDGSWLIVPESTQTSALAVRSFLQVADVNTLVRQTQAAAATAGTGIVEMGPGDALEFFVLGTNAANETANVMVTALMPVYSAKSNKDNDEAPTGYNERLVASYVCTLGALAVSVGEGEPSGVDNGDLWADTMVATATGTEGFVTYSPADDTKAFAIVPADQAPFLLVRTDRGTCDTVIVLGRRIRGGAQR